MFGVWGLKESSSVLPSEVLKIVSGAGFGVWFLVFGFWFLVFGFWCLEFGVWSLNFDVRCLASEFSV